MKNPEKCKHRFKAQSYSGCLEHEQPTLHKPTSDFSFSKEFTCTPYFTTEMCSLCKDKRYRNPIGEERQRLIQEKKEDNRHIDTVFKLWRRFVKEFINTENGVPVNPPSDKWKYFGYDMMERVAEFAKKYPEIKIGRCDDSCHSGSNIVFIPHRDKLAKKKEDKYWGTTVIVIPQCDGQYPCEFFLDPDHRNQLLKTLKGLK